MVGTVSGSKNSAFVGSIGMHTRPEKMKVICNININKDQSSIFPIMLQEFLAIGFMHEMYYLFWDEHKMAISAND